MCVSALESTTSLSLCLSLSLFVSVSPVSLPLSLSLSCPQIYLSTYLPISCPLSPPPVSLSFLPSVSLSLSPVSLYLSVLLFSVSLCLILSLFLSPPFSAKPGSRLTQGFVVWAALIVPHAQAEPASWHSTFSCCCHLFPGKTPRLRALAPCPRPTAPKCLQVRIFKTP